MPGNPDSVNTKMVQLSIAYDKVAKHIFSLSHKQQNIYSLNVAKNKFTSGVVSFLFRIYFLPYTYARYILYSLLLKFLNINPIISTHG